MFNETCLTPDYQFYATAAGQSSGPAGAGYYALVPTTATYRNNLNSVVLPTATINTSTITVVPMNDEVWSSLDTWAKDAVISAGLSLEDVTMSNWEKDPQTGMWTYIGPGAAPTAAQLTQDVAAYLAATGIDVRTNITADMSMDQIRKLCAARSAFGSQYGSQAPTYAAGGTWMTTTLPSGEHCPITSNEFTTYYNRFIANPSSSNSNTNTINTNPASPITTPTPTSTTTPFSAAVQSSFNTVLQEFVQQLQELQSQIALLGQIGVSQSSINSLFSPAINQISQGLVNLQASIRNAGDNASSTTPTPITPTPTPVITPAPDSPWAGTQIDNVTKWVVTPERCADAALLKQAYQLMATAAASTPDIVVNGGKAPSWTLEIQPGETPNGTSWTSLYDKTPASTKYSLSFPGYGNPYQRFSLHEWWAGVTSSDVPCGLCQPKPTLFNPNYDGSLGRSTDLKPTTAVCPESGPIRSSGLIAVSQQNIIVRIDDTANVTIIAGTAPFSIITPPNTGVATVLLSGTNISITGVDRGQTSFTVEDSSSPAITSTVKVSVNPKPVPYVAPVTHQVTVTCLTAKVNTADYWGSECYTPDYQFIAEGSGQYYALVPVPAAGQTRITTYELPLSYVTTKQIEVEPINCAVWSGQDSAMKALIQQMGLFTPTYTSAGQDTCDSY
jgi:hypothetical protein